MNLMTQHRLKLIYDKEDRRCGRNTVLSVYNQIVVKRCLRVATKEEIRTSTTDHTEFHGKGISD
jgi:hypothetical protein